MTNIPRHDQKKRRFRTCQKGKRYGGKLDRMRKFEISANISFYHTPSC